MACQYCGCQDIEQGIVGTGNDNASNFALTYRRGGIFVGLTTVYFDLCKNCGAITKMYIKESTDKNWYKE